MPSTSEPQVLIEHAGALGRIRLNRPKALNSLTLRMVREIGKALDTFEADPAVATVLISGEGERGLCAGGDIRMIYESGKAGSQEPIDFWREEYRLNARLNRFPKPLVAFMDGIVMGGGVGVCVYASHRIVTERTRLAMPETGIGFFPDVGASWFLTRGNNELGTYAALTGAALAAGDAIALGLADSYVPSGRLAELAEALTRLPGGRAALPALIAAFAAPPPPAEVAARQAPIDRLFAFDTVEEIFTALERDGSLFAQETLAVLKAKSPLTLKVTLRLLRLGRRETALEACLEREFAATAAVLRSPDFYEGVRAAVIDKDRNPQWRPARLEAVAAGNVAAFFEPSAEPLFAGDAAKGEPT